MKVFLAPSLFRLASYARSDKMFQLNLLGIDGTTSYICFFERIESVFSNMYALIHCYFDRNHFDLVRHCLSFGVLTIAPCSNKFFVTTGV